MKSLVISEPGQSHFEERPEPVAETSGALLRVRTVGLCGTDLSTYRGKNPLVTYPRVPGHEISATIEELYGEAPVGLKPGMNVAVSPYKNCGHCGSCRRGRPNACQFNETFGVQRDGALTKFITVPYDRLIFAEGLTARHLSIVEPLTIGFHAVRRGRITADDTVAIFGSGGVGMGAVSGAAFRGAKVIAVDVDDAKLALAKEAGATHTIRSDRESVHDRLQEFTDGFGPDVIIEAIGLPETFRAAVEEVAWAGRVVYIGYAKEPVSYETRWFVQKELDIMGSRNALPEDFAEVVAMLRSGKFPIETAISHVFPFDEAGNAFAAWSANPAPYRKILIEVNA